MTQPSQNGWKWACVALIVLLFTQFYYIFVPRRTYPFSRQPIQQDQAGSWDYNVERDSSNIALSSAQCDIAFPKLYLEIDRSVSYWKNKGHTITAADIDISNHKERESAFNVLIYENHLGVTDHKEKWLGKRSLYVLGQINRALLGAEVAGEKLPCVEFSVGVGDFLPVHGTHTAFAFARELSNPRHEALWLMPEFTYFAAPPSAGPWHQMQRMARAHDDTISHKIPKIAWRGVTWTNEKIRGSLLNATRDEPWADVEVMDWDGEADNIVEIDDLCRYMFLAHTEGRSYSSRLIYLLNCRSLSFVHDLEWTTHIYHLLEPDGPDQNYVPVKRDFSDLEKNIEKYLQNPVEAQRIADNAVSTFRDRYTSPAALSCYWRRLIQRYSEVSFTPDPFEDTEVTISGTSMPKKQLRGVSFEEILLTKVKAANP